jgi:radical SAM superfamily enzyme YgiQ (UPF0313 family)
MSSLGFHTVYHEFNSLPGVVCERAFFPESGRISRAIRTLESDTPLPSFDVVAFSVAYEMDLVRMVQMLSASGIPPCAADRNDRHPLVLAGGPCPTFNPEPIADIVDACAVGEGEEIIPDIVDAVCRSASCPDRLAALAQIEGVYVPGMYRVSHDPSGCVARVEAKAPAPFHVKRRYLKDLDSKPTHTRIFTNHTEFGRMFLLETARGCGRGCRFCVADHAFRPPRRRSLDSLLKSAEGGLRYRDTIGLLAPSVTDHRHIDELAEGILKMGGKISVASLRADSVTETVLRCLAESGAKTITIAPEAGTQRLRDVIGKRISEEQYMQAARMASRLGIKRVKLYFMVGLPTETEEDVGSIGDFVRRLRTEGRLEQVTVSCAAFVPKPKTPWERHEMMPTNELRHRLGIIRSALSKERWARLAFEGLRESFLQAVLSRGDRRLGQVLISVAQTPGNQADWREAFSSCGPSTGSLRLRSGQAGSPRAESRGGLDPAWFALRQRQPDEVLPWAHIG